MHENEKEFIGNDKFKTEWLGMECPLCKNTTVIFKYKETDAKIGYLKCCYCDTTSLNRDNAVESKESAIRRWKVPKIMHCTCGGNARLKKERDRDNKHWEGNFVWWVECDKCGLRTTKEIEEFEPLQKWKELISKGKKKQLGKIVYKQIGGY